MGRRALPRQKHSDRIFSGLQQHIPSSSIRTRQDVATIKNGTRVDSAWDGISSKKLIYIPNGGEGNVTVVHQDSPDKYTTVCHGRYVCRREDDRSRSKDAQRVTCSSLSAVRRRPPTRWRGATGKGGAPAGSTGPIVAAWFIAIKQ